MCHGDLMSRLPRLDGHRILVVEDNDIIAELWASVLEGEGAQIVGPVTGITQAMRAIEQHVPHAAVLDVQLSDGLSFPVARALLARSIPYAFVASFDSRDLPADLDRSVLLPKPTSVASLIDAVEGLIRGTCASGAPDTSHP